MPSVRTRQDNGTPIVRQFAALFSAGIAFAGVAISIANIWVAQINKSKDEDIATRKEFREYFAANRAIIFGNDLGASEQIRDVMKITFPKELWEPAFRTIIRSVPEKKSQELFSTDLGQTISGRIQTFGGPDDIGDEDLALIDRSDLPNFSQYFLPEQPPGTTGLGRRLNPNSFYIAVRWNYDETPRSLLKSNQVTVVNPSNGKSAKAQPVDWGPNARTGRVADLSPGLAKELGLKINDLATIKLPKSMFLTQRE